MSGILRNVADFDQAAAAGLRTLYPPQLKILVGSASCGVAMGAPNVEAAARRAVVPKMGALSEGIRNLYGLPVVG